MDPAVLATVEYEQKKTTIKDFKKQFVACGVRRSRSAADCRRLL